MWRLALALALVTASACVQSQLNSCLDGLQCPIGRACDDVHRDCVNPDQVTACAGLADGATCELELGLGVCDGGVCVGASCGDGFVTSEERCDDGNQIGGDGCSADCLSSELCGNGVIDVALGESCDCGSTELGPDCVSLNSDQPGATCKTNCVAHCGDGEVNAAEACDTRPTSGGCLRFGFDRGPLACSATCADDFTACGEFGIKALDGPGISATIGDMWVAPTGETFIVGGARAVGVGGAWTVALGSQGTGWAGVSGTSASDVMAVGSVFSMIGLSTTTVVSRWNGTSWTSSPAPTIAGALAVYGNDVALLGPTDAVVVGGTYLSFQSPQVTVLMFTWDGTQWTRSLTGVVGELKAVARIGATTDLVAVGPAGLVAWRRGGVWTTETIAGAPNLDAVWVGAADNIIAVGQAGAVYQFDGAVWRAHLVPTSANLRAVAGSGNADIYAAAGTSGVFHYDGVGWFPVAMDAATVGIGALHANAGEVRAVGLGFTTYRFAPGGWGELSLGPGIGASITGAGGTVFATAFRTLYRYDGVDAQQVAVVGTEISATHALAADELYLGHGNAVDRYDGAVSVVFNAAEAVVALWAQQTGHLHVASKTNIRERLADGTVTTHPIALAAQDQLVAIAGAGSIVYALSRDGAVWSNRSGPWAVEIELGIEGISLWVAPDATVFVGGDSGRSWRFDGLQWLPLALDTTERIVSIHGAAPDDVFAATFSSLHHFDGQRWSPVNTRGARVGKVFTTGRDAYFFNPSQFRRLKRPTRWN